MKRFITFVMIISIVFCFAGCNPEEKLHGTWIYETDDESALYSYISYEFNDNGNLVRYCEKNNSSEGNVWVRTLFEYVIEDSKIILTKNDQLIEEKSFSLKRDVLTIDGKEFVKNPKNKKDTIKYENAMLIEVGMTYEEVEQIIGQPKRDVGANNFLFEWDVDNGKILLVCFERTSGQKEVDTKSAAYRVSLE